LGYISRGISLCGKGQLSDAMEAFDLGFVFSNGDAMVMNLLLLIKVPGSIFDQLVITYNSRLHSRLSYFSMQTTTMKQFGEFKT